VLYERRVLLLLDEQLSLPLDLRSLPHFKFDGGDLTWDAGMKLMKAVKAFKNGTWSEEEDIKDEETFPLSSPRG
jgi:hypothetical protein